MKNFQKLAKQLGEKFPEAFADTKLAAAWLQALVENRKIKEIDIEKFDVEVTEDYIDVFYDGELVDYLNR
jgi:hypothetical protein